MLLAPRLAPLVNDLDLFTALNYFRTHARRALVGQTGSAATMAVSALSRVSRPGRASQFHIASLEHAFDVR
jgi:hypothetical protein